MQKVLTVDFEKCTGCRLCELVCSVTHDGVSNPARSRIKVVKWEAEGQYVPMICQQCEDAPCQQGCPTGAIARDRELGSVKVNYDICIGCRTCVGVCPFGAMKYNMADHKVIKCDLCGGEPQCVRFCEVKAVNFMDADILDHQKKKKAASRVRSAQKGVLGCEAG